MISASTWYAIRITLKKVLSLYMRTIFQYFSSLISERSKECIDFTIMFSFLYRQHITGNGIAPIFTSDSSRDRQLARDGSLFETFS